MLPKPDNKNIKNINTDSLFLNLNQSGMERASETAISRAKMETINGWNEYANTQ